MGKEKVFQDATQGYITIDTNYTQNIIDTFEMQRLKDVAQTGIRSIYSGATHDRFSHSLGVYNIGLKIYASFSKNLLDVASSANLPSSDIKSLLDECSQYYQIACLLHDIGHPAFSHTFEYLYNNDSINLMPDCSSIKIGKAEVTRIKTLCEQKATDRQYENILKAAFIESLENFYLSFAGEKGEKYEVITSELHSSPHETMGALQVLSDKKIKDAIYNTFASDKAVEPPTIDYGFIACMIVGLKYKTEPKKTDDGFYSKRASIRNCIIELLNGMIDADNIDYLNRNSHFAGYSTANLDITRLTAAFSVSYDKRSDTFAPCFKKSVLSAIDEFVNARDFEPKWLYGHHKIVYCGRFLNPFLYKKSCRYLFAMDQAQWELQIAYELISRLQSNPTFSSFSFDYENNNLVLSDCLKCLYKKVESTYIGLTGKYSEFFPVFLALADEGVNTRSSFLTQLWGQLNESDKKEAVAYKKITDALKVLFRVKPLFSLNHLFCCLLNQMADKFTSDMAEDATALLHTMSECNTVLTRIKDAYLCYIMSPMVHFERSLSESSPLADIYYKSSDSDINALFKRQYLYYQNKAYADLTEAEKSVGEEKEYNMYKDVLTEYHTRKYRQSLWKSQDEYRLFLSQLSKETGLSQNALNRIIINYITENGKVEEFEDSETYQYAKKKEDINAAFLRKSEDSANSAFDILGDGIVICIYKQKRKSFGKIQVHIGNDALLEGGNNGLVSYGELAGEKKQSDEYFPYIYYKAEDVKGRDRNSLLLELKEKIVRYVTDNCMGDTKMYSEASSLSNGKIIRDPVHGDIFVPEKFLKLIDTKAFQRLRRIKQLATADLVYPEAEHTRFAHSLGTFHVMTMIINHFCTLFDYLGISYTETEKNAALVAALLHDIGHGPYSHAYENMGENKKSHEQWTTDIITSDHELNSVLASEFGENFCDYVIDCLENSTIAGDTFKLKDVFSFLVSSQLDADRIDYLMRDSYNTGIRFGTLDLQKIISAMALTEYNGKMHVCIDESAVPTIEQLFIGRYNMYDSVYFAPYKLYSEALLSKIGKKIYTSKDYNSRSLLGKIYTNNISLEEYLSLDDISLQREIYNCVEASNDHTLQKMVTCFYNRNGYERVRILNESASDNHNFFVEFKERFGVDLKEYYGVIFVQRTYSAYDLDNSEAEETPGNTVLVSKRNGTITDFASASKVFAQQNPQVNNSRGKTDCLWKTTKSYIYINFEILKDEWPDLKEKSDEVHRFVDNYNIRNHTEIEQKYSCNAAAIKTAADWTSLTQKNENLQKYTLRQETDSRKQTDTYFDTPDLMLAKSGFSLRQRKIGGQNKYIYTIKASIDANNGNNRGQFIRSEFEYETESEDINTAEVTQFIKPHLLNILNKSDRTEDILNLENTITIHNNRVSYVVAKEHSDFVCEISLDSVEYQRGIEKKPDYQIEIELKSSNPIHRIELQAFADEFKKALNITGKNDEDESKYMKALRAYDLL